MQATSYLNPADAVPYEGIAGSDRKHRVTVACMYQLPFGRRGKLLRSIPKKLDAAIGGWQLSTGYVYQSGIPLSWSEVVFFGVGDDIRTGPYTPEQWFNTNAGFTRETAIRPASYHYRTWPFRFSNVRGPAMNNADVSVNKRWQLNEHGAEIQFRGEALNGFNRVHFGNPNTDQFNSAANYARQIQVVIRASF